MSKWIDITVPLDAGTTAWPGDRAFEQLRDSVLEEGAECNLSSFAMSAHLGTHMDAPLHYLAGGESMDGLPFDAVVGPARVIEVPAAQVTEADLARHCIQAGERILLKTPNSDRSWLHQPFRRGYAHLTVAGAAYLAGRRPALVGIDYLSVGGPDESGAEVHRVLLRAHIWIVESLNLHGVEPGDYDLVCLPLRIAGVEGAPARALLKRKYRDERHPVYTDLAAMLKPTIFREYDIRGVAETELLSGDIVSLGKGFGTFLKREAGPRIVVASDCRLSSPRLKDALIQGLTATGCEVTDAGIVATPLLYFAQVHLKSDGAIMITGSHNPPEYNGFKAVAAGHAIFGEDIQRIRRLIETGGFEVGDGSRCGHDVSDAYVDEIASQFHFSRRVKVVLDAGNGTAGPVMRRLLARLDVEPVEMYFEMDGRFPNHHPDPTLPENLEDLAEAVKKHGAELGLAFDGDSDRIGAVDERGRVVYGDMLMLIFGREILKRKPGATFIGEVKCSQVLYDELNRLGGNAIMYKTGHSLIKAKMKQEGAELAGEMSGHMFFKDRYYGYDDALYAACRLIEIVADSGQPLSAQLAGLPKMVSTPEIRIDCSDELKFGVVARVAREFKGTHRVIDIDGVRVVFARGWGLLRASNTQPVLVMRFEAENEALLKQYRDEVEAALQRAKEAL